MSPKTLLVTLLFVIVTSQFTVQSVILRPDWFPYFRDDTDVKSSVRSERNLAQENIPCPDDMTEYECYHTFMAVWTRLLHKDKRVSASNEAQQSLARRLSR